MTPAKLFCLREEHMRELELRALPVDKLAWQYHNSHRDPGDPAPPLPTPRPAAPVQPLSVFRTYYSLTHLDGPLAAKDQVEEWDYSLLGAKADRDAFETWAGHHLGRLVSAEEI